VSLSIIETFQSKSVDEWRRDIALVISEYGELVHYDRKQTIFHQDEPASSVYAIKNGLIETLCLNQAAREVTLSVRGPYETFGYSEVVLGVPRTRRAATLLDAEIWKLESSKFLRLLLNKPEIVLSMLGSALHRSTQSSDMRAELRGTSAFNRVGYVLCKLSVCTSELARAKTPVLPISHEELSRVCELSRQTVTKTLGIMQQQGIVELGIRSIRVLDPVKLNDLIEEGLLD